MNTETGELRMLKSLMDLTEEEQKAFTKVPKKHEAEASAILDGKESAQADMSKETPLVQWAIQNTQREKASKLKDMQKASKKKNRGR